jgi:uncharacterized caspase-like protein
MKRFLLFRNQLRSGAAPFTLHWTPNVVSQPCLQFYSVYACIPGLEKKQNGEWWRRIATGLCRATMRQFTLVFIVLLLGITTAPTTFALQNNHVALVISNAEYSLAEAPSIEPLKAVVSKSRDLGQMLSRRGFDVNVAENLKKAEMQRALEIFYRKITPGSTALIFFSGFAIQTNRDNFIVPVDAQIWNESDVRRDGFSLGLILEELNSRGAQVKIALIDASRRNPFERNFRSAPAGLAAVQAPHGTAALTSALPDTVVSDGTTPVFLTALIMELGAPNATIEQVFNRTRLDVSRATNGQQVPWLSSSLEEDVPFGLLVATANRHFALVIGNSNYEHAPALPNPTKDGEAIANMFQRAGYMVVNAHDVSNLDFKRAIRQFEDAAANSDVAVVYYAGHGIEIHGTNYLIPVDAKLASDRDAEDEAVELDRLINAVDGAKQLSLVILDACRDNPFAHKTLRQGTAAVPAITAGLSAAKPTAGNMLIAFAAKACSGVEDGQGDHSPFTTALLDNLFVPGLDVRLAFGRVRDEVLKITSNLQDPFVYGSLSPANISVVPVPDNSVPARDPQGEKADYSLVEKIGTETAWQAFLAQHPTGVYSDLARQQLAKLRLNGGDQSRSAGNIKVVTHNAQPEQKASPQTGRTNPDLRHTNPPNTLLWWWPQWR